MVFQKLKGCDILHVKTFEIKCFDSFSINVLVNIATIVALPNK